MSSIEQRVAETRTHLEFARDAEPHPSYYRLQNSTSATIAEFFEKPQELLNSFEKQNEKLSLTDWLAVAALKLPALVGSAVSRLIYRVKGEKIKELDYKDAYNEWMQKSYGGFDEKLIKHFIDTCIQNKIRANDCKFDAVILSNISKSHGKCMGHAFALTF